MRAISQFLHLRRLDWRMGKIAADFAHARQVHECGIREEQKLFSNQRKAVQALWRTAAQGISESPWAAVFLASELEERLQRIRIPRKSSHRERESPNHKDDETPPSEGTGS